MSFDNRWDRVRKLGSGGQGEVWLVRDKERNNLASVKQMLRDALGLLNSARGEHRDDGFEKFCTALTKIGEAEPLFRFSPFGKRAASR